MSHPNISSLRTSTKNSTLPSTQVRSKARSTSMFTSEYLYESPTVPEKRLPIDFDEMWGETSLGDDISVSNPGIAKGNGKTKSPCTQKLSTVSPRCSTHLSPSQKKKKILSTPTVPPSPFSKTKLAKLLMKNGLQIDIHQDEQPKKESTSAHTSPRGKGPVPMSPGKKPKVPDSPRKAPKLPASPTKCSKPLMTPGKISKTPTKIIQLKMSTTIAPLSISKPEPVNVSKWKQLLKASPSEKNAETIESRLETTETSSGSFSLAKVAKPATSESGSAEALPMWDDAEDDHENLKFDDIWEDTEVKGDKKTSIKLKDETKKQIEPKSESLFASEPKNINEETTKDEDINESEYDDSETECNKSKYEDETDDEGSDYETGTEYDDETNFDDDETDAEETETETEIDSMEDTPQATECKANGSLETIKDGEEISEKQDTTPDGDSKLSRKEMIEKMRDLQSKFSDVLGRLSGAAEKLKSFKEASDYSDDEYSSDGSLTVSTMQVESRMLRDELPRKSKSKKSSVDQSCRSSKSSKSTSSKSKSSNGDKKKPKEKSTRKKTSKHIVDMRKEESTRTYDTLAWG
mmetsp:Transcript_25100/g.47672  ORF Transcript_25100/g.47672 Transcript_25100/m.47672 type:complete len:578 (-) Transcript_25100:49-1782(-)